MAVQGAVNRFIFCGPRNKARKPLATAKEDANPVCVAINQYGILEIQISSIMASGTNFVLKPQYPQMEKI
ncbi:hypothetical protein ABID16_001479 [Rhizobium aquaticum]|uniref:Uncharacterized protein n=1 Tax=Rhizobium aquaticum TaxID=1549636 RepID=A0ABV2IZV7_9HYPH